MPGPSLRRPAASARAIAAASAAGSRWPRQSPQQAHVRPVARRAASAHARRLRQTAPTGSCSRPAGCRKRCCSPPARPIRLAGEEAAKSVRKRKTARLAGAAASISVSSFGGQVGSADQVPGEALVGLPGGLGDRPRRAWRRRRRRRPRPGRRSARAKAPPPAPPPARYSRPCRRSHRPAGSSATVSAKFGSPCTMTRSK